MLPISVPGVEKFDEVSQEFIYGPSTELDLEHSLISISKWESKYHKPFLGPETKTSDEMLDYIRFMTINKPKDPTCYERLTDKNVDEIKAYIDDPMTATKITPAPGGKKKAGGSKVVTSELIYYWLVQMNIPFEVEKWHLNRLLKLVEVVSEKNQPKKKIPKKQTLRSQAAINEARRRASGSSG